MYNLIDGDTIEALEVLNRRDEQENTIIHILARKGDENILTLRDLLGMRLADQKNTRVFSVSIRNAKGQLPMHIATQVMITISFHRGSDVSLVSLPPAPAAN